MTQLDRRSLTKAAAWSVPVIVVATAAPAHAQGSGDPEPEDVNVGAYKLTGTCGILGVVPPGFNLTAGPTEALPVGTTVLVTASGVANSGVFTLTPNIGSVVVLSGTSRLITLTSPLPAGTTVKISTTLSISVAFTLNATASLPTGYVATGAKPAGTVSSTLILCSAT